MSLSELLKNEALRVRGYQQGFPSIHMGVDNGGLSGGRCPGWPENRGHSMNLGVGQPLTVTGGHLETQGSSGVPPWGLQQALEGD